MKLTSTTLEGEVRTVRSVRQPLEAFLCTFTRRSIGPVTLSEPSCWTVASVGQPRTLVWCGREAELCPVAHRGVPGPLGTAAEAGTAGLASATIAPTTVTNFRQGAVLIPWQSDRLTVCARSRTQESLFRRRYPWSD